MNIFYNFKLTRQNPIVNLHDFWQCKPLFNGSGPVMALGRFNRVMVWADYDSTDPYFGIGL